MECTEAADMPPKEWDIMAAIGRNAMQAKGSGHPSILKSWKTATKYGLPHRGATVPIFKSKYRPAY